ncbi:MAG: hypothetical protein CSA33_07910 [Desulfobulbus propionicus]|nr:MAG: hypothetical protein CSA33_07910 [Desulfobulbus propionicus]
MIFPLHATKVSIATGSTDLQKSMNGFSLLVVDLLDAILCQRTCWPFAVRVFDCGINGWKKIASRGQKTRQRCSQSVGEGPPGS